EQTSAPSVHGFVSWNGWFSPHGARAQQFLPRFAPENQKLPARPKSSSRSIAVGTRSFAAWQIDACVVSLTRWSPQATVRHANARRLADSPVPARRSCSFQV